MQGLGSARLVAALHWLVLTFAMLAASGHPSPAQDLKETLQAKSVHAEDIGAQLADTSVVRVIVRHKSTSPAHAAGATLGTDPIVRSEAVRAVDVAQRRLLATHVGSDTAKEKRWATRRIDQFPLMAMTVTGAELSRLVADPDVEHVWHDKMHRHSLDQSVPLIGMTGGSGAYAFGADGTGMSIAIIDSGVDKSHPFLAGKVIDEACYSSTITGYNYPITSMCPNGGAQQFGTGAGVNCPAYVDGCEHGTHVAGIAAGLNSGVGGPYYGVAKAAKIVSVQVFSRVDGVGYCVTSASCSIAFTSDILAGLSYILYRAPSYSQPLAAVNMSLGGGSLFGGYCYGAYTYAFDALVAANIAPVVAAGNNGSTGGISEPACTPGAVAVGATTKSDQVAYYTNISGTVGFFAPGSSIVSSVPGGGYATLSGTSMAAPHVAGAIAAVRSKFPGTSLSTVLNYLKSTGKAIPDNTRDNGKVGSSLTKPRIAVDAALDAMLVPNGVKAAMVSPAPGTTLTNAEFDFATFTWNAGYRVREYWLSVGSTPGGTDLGDGSTGTDLTKNIQIPVDGRPIYVRLWSHMGETWQYTDYTYTAAGHPPPKATLVSPVDGSVFTSNYVTFTWAAASGPTALHWLSVGSKPGGIDIFDLNAGYFTNSAANVKIPHDGRKVYVRLWTKVVLTWQYIDYVYTAVGDGVGGKAEITSPAPGTTLPAQLSTQFQWTVGANVDQYWLYVGSTLGGQDIVSKSIDGPGVNSYAGLTTVALPYDGRTIYVRLWSLLGTKWVYNDYTYTAAPQFSGAKADMTYPAVGSKLLFSFQDFYWSTGTNASEYWLSVGTSEGAANLYSKTNALSTVASVNSLPQDGNSLYVRLWTLLNGKWLYNDYVYTASGLTGGKAVMTSPTQGTAWTNSSVSFTWTTGIGASQYWLSIGDTPGGNNRWDQSKGSSLNATVFGMPMDGRKQYVRLWSQIGTVWQYNDYTYSAVDQAAGTKAVMSSPVNGSTLQGTLGTFTWSVGVAASEYWLSVGNTIGGSDIYGQSASVTTTALVPNLPTDGRAIYVRLWTKIAGTWLSNDYTYLAAKGLAAAMLQPTNGSTLTNGNADFRWSTSTPTLFSEYWLYVGSTAGGTDLYNKTAGTTWTASVTGLPTDGRKLYVRLWSKFVGGGWVYSDTTLTAYDPNVGTKGVLTNPVAGSKLTTNWMTFAWNYGTNVTEYWFAVGSAAGGTDIYNQSAGFSSTAFVAPLPSDGRTLYVRLRSKIGSAWQDNDYTFIAATAVKAVPFVPGPGGKLFSSSVTFSWMSTTPGLISEYWLSIGNTAGATDVYSQSAGTATSAAVTSLPSDGRTLYVRLRSKIDGVWLDNDYTVTASGP